jgi:carbamoylphosphate synthase large subunit
VLVVIYGKGLWSSWKDALGADSEFWKGFSSIEKVIEVDNIDFPLQEICKNYNKTVLIPLSVEDNFNHPKGYLTLVSSHDTLNTFNNKDLFYEFLEQNDLQEYFPKLLNTTSSTPEFPFIMKRLDLYGGVGIVLIWDQERYEWALNNHRFKDHRYLVQEYIEGDVEYVTQVMCKDGEVLWNVTFEGPVPRDGKVNMGPFAENKIVTMEPEVLDVFRKIFKLANYSGPANVNFKLRDGKPVIFESNPRFGGSMFLPMFRPQLKQSITALLNNAYLQTDTPDVR